MKTTIRINKTDKSNNLKLAWSLFKAQNIKTSEMFSICLKQAWNTTKVEAEKRTIEYIIKNNSGLIKTIIRNEMNRYNIKDSDLLNDLYCETLIKINDNLCIFNPCKAKLTSWISVIAKNHTKDYFKTTFQKLRQNLSVSSILDQDGQEFIEIVDRYSDTSLSAENQELLNQIENAMTTLKPLQAQAFRMFKIDGFTYKEIADSLNISIDNVKVTLNRANKAMQDLLSQAKETKTSKSSYVRKENNFVMDNIGYYDLD
jgi:RNA polymerase sigma factor (sigma-70 family)